MTEQLRVLAILGSLRQGSYNAAVLRQLPKLAPAGMTIEPVGLADIPLYNDDVRQQGYPAPVAQLRSAVAAADGVLFVTPEYNYSMPGVLKNAIDWVSRPPDQPLDGKPVAIITASPGLMGGSRAQYHWRQSMVFLNAFPLNKPEVMIPQITNKLNEQGELIDQTTRDLITAQLAAFAGWIRRMAR